MKRLLFAETFRLGDCLYTAAVVNALQQAVTGEFHVIVSELSGGFDFIWKKMGVQVHRFSFPWEKSGWQFHPGGILRSLERVKKEMRREFSGTPGFNPRGSNLQTHVLKAAGASPVMKLEFAEGTSLVWRFLGRDGRNVFDSRKHFLAQCAWSAERTLPALDTAFLRRYISPEPFQNRVLLSPGASSPVKFWEVARWIELAGCLLKSGFSVEAVSHPSSNVSDEQWPSAVSLFSGSVEALARRIGGSRAVVSPDSFVAHLAAAMGTKPVVLFGSQEPALWSPPGAAAVLAEDIPCRPCAQKLSRCPVNHRCMKNLSSDQVFNAVIKETHENASFIF